MAEFLAGPAGFIPFPISLGGYLVKSVVLISLGSLLGAAAMFAVINPLKDFFRAPALTFVGPAAPTVVTSTAPTIESIRQKGMLEVQQANVSDLLLSHGKGYEGVWLVKGDCQMCVDLTKAEVISVAADQRKITIRLPQPQTQHPRVDHSRTRQFDLKSHSFTNYIGFGDRSVHINEAMENAQKLVEQLCQSEELSKQARMSAKQVLTKMYEMVEWTIEVEWEQPDNRTPQT